MKKIFFMAIVLSFACQLSPRQGRINFHPARADKLSAFRFELPACFAEGRYYTDKDRDMEMKYLKSKLETAEKNYWAIPKNERYRYKYSFDRYCEQIDEKIHLLTWDPEQYFFEKAENERASARRVIIQNE